MQCKPPYKLPFFWYPSPPLLHYLAHCYPLTLGLTVQWISFQSASLAGWSSIASLVQILPAVLTLKSAIRHKMPLHAQYLANMCEICTTKRSWKDPHIEG